MPVATITAVGTAGPGGDGSTIRYGIVLQGQPCRATEGGDTVVFRGLPDGQVYTFVLCVESWSAGTLFGSASTSADVRAVQSGAAPTGYTFVVGPTAHVSDGRATWTIDQTPTSRETPPNQNVAVFSGLPSSIFDSDPRVQVRYEHTAGWWQSAWATVTPARGSAPYQVQATWALGTCAGGARLDATGNSTGGLAQITFDPAYYDANGALLPLNSDPWIVPDEAVRVEAQVSVDWAGRGWNLDPATGSIAALCTPLPAPPVTP